MGTDIALEKTWSPNWAVHPGEHVEEHMESRGWTQADLARIADVSPKLISTIISGKNPVTPETALKLERVFGLRAEVWLNMQANWALTNARNAEMKAAMSTAELDTWLPRFPIAELKGRGALPKVANKAEIGAAILNFFEIGSFAAFEAKYGSLAVQHRQARSSVASSAHIYAWLKLGENKALEMDLPKYDEIKFSNAVKEIRSLTVCEPEIFEPHMTELCRQAGVAFVLEKPISKTSLYGSARWVSGEVPVIQMSLRMKSNDHFWWTFFHEAAHLLLHKGRNFADDKNGVGDGLEDEADAWAEDILVGKSTFYSFKISYPRSEAQILDFAHSIKIHPGIVVGMLQHARILPFTHLNKLKARFDWADEQT